jgi:hypothetical protein
MHSTAIEFLMSSHRGRGVSACVVPIFVGAALWPAHANAPAPASLPLAQILALMEHHDQIQREGLKHYTAIRQYHVEYRGLANLEAGMEVEVDFDATSGKSFRIVSQSGSKILGEKVLKRAMDSEKEASEDGGATALTAANYRFQLQGSESLDGRPAYILSVEPLRESKFLYRGKIWVDATDFAVAKAEATPAKNPVLDFADGDSIYEREDGKLLAAATEPQRNQSSSRGRCRANNRLRGLPDQFG